MKNPKTNNLTNPALNFTNPLKRRSEISSQLKNKSGIYQWYNPNNGASYIGSSSDLSRRFNEYVNRVNSLNKELARGESIILKALAKSGIDSFEFRIIEFIEISSNLNTELLHAEQAYLDLVNPEYNILKLAGSNRGHKLSSETKAKMSKAQNLRFSSKTSSFKHTVNSKLLMSANSKVTKEVFVYESTNTSDSGLLNTFKSVTQACAYLNYYPTRLVKYINNNLILDNKYIISWTRLDSSSINNYNHPEVKISGPVNCNLVYAYLLDIENKPTTLAFKFINISDCARFFHFSNSKTLRLVKGQQKTSIFTFEGQNYILSHDLLI